MGKFDRIWFPPSPKDKHISALEAERDALVATLDFLLCEAEDVFVCMADATGQDRHSYPWAYITARKVLAAALSRKDSR